MLFINIIEQVYVFSDDLYYAAVRFLKVLRERREIAYYAHFLLLSTMCQTLIKLPISRWFMFVSEKVLNADNLSYITTGK